MFERYTEKARRVIFFARYEASQFGSPVIDTEHLLLGLIREDKRAYGWAPKAQPPEVLRQRIEGLIPRQQPISTALDLPLSEAGKRVLHSATDEADRMKSRQIETEHLFLALLQQDCATSKLLIELGADLKKLRSAFEQVGAAASSSGSGLARETHLRAAPEMITIHNIPRNLHFVQGVVGYYRQLQWDWRKQPWTPRDIVVHRKTGKLSFDLSLAEDPASFQLLKEGWKKDHCVICHWELFESKDDASHGTGYTNGRDWLCTECYQRFWERSDFISGSYGEIT